ncbi:hypothetical protein A6769_38270 [Nostoc punctiforme NIES-2108]|uniref:Uncharacterized protein n=1 Tax=Nostoc punctiforme NIES-2108 TaxID=1356359 RepID=A0A367S3R6_NOSPU|nr:hypothetical protein A6769_38270 [Nostoc punctiforme NIES-2108]
MVYAEITKTRRNAYTGNPQGVPLLRLKTRIGDQAPQVISECFSALLQLAPADSLAIVAGFLFDPKEQICELAALTLGESRLEEAFDLLRNCWEQTRNVELRRTLLLAIGMLRQDKAIDFLISYYVRIITYDKSRDENDEVCRKESV